MVSINPMPSGLKPEGFFPDFQRLAPATTAAQGPPAAASGVQPQAAIAPPGAEQGQNPLSRQHAEELVQNMNRVLEGINPRLQFGLHGEAETFYVRVIDNQTNKTIKTLPSEQLLDLRDKIHHMVGTLVDENG